MTADESRAIVLDWIDAVNRGDGEAVAGRFADDATWWVSGSLPVSGLYEGRDAIMRDFFAPALELFQPGTFRLEPKSVIAEGNRVAVEWEGFAISAKGRDYHQRYHMAFELTEGGQIAAVREYNDTLYSSGVLFS
jgi:hypothetical protein